MYKIIVPASIDVLNPQTGDKIETVTFAKYIRVNVCGDKSFGKGIKELRSAMTISSAFDKAKEGDTVEIHSNDWNMMKTAVESPDGGYAPLMAVQLLPFLETVLKATEVTEAKKSTESSETK